MFKTIIMAYDGSAASERVLLYAEHMARQEGADIIVVHAYETPTVYDWSEGFDALSETFESIANEVTDDAVQALCRNGINAMSDVRQGPPVRAILEAVGFHQADLIVMGGRAQKRENVAEALLGSVSTAVLRYANCPVLVVP
jgi:nucleotide-binding universal stress UspA family protein